MFDFDLFVIGAGSGGVRAARMAAGMGARVAVAEDRYLGGTCVNAGCIPKKLYAFAAHYRHDFADSAGFGWKTTRHDFDWVTLRDNKSKEIQRLNTIYRQILDKAGARIIRGRATITGPNAVTVDNHTYSAKYILVATGGWPFVPDLPGSQHGLTSNDIFDLPALPQRILVVGGGYIAVEFAGIFAGLGSVVTLAYRGKEVLRHFDQDLRRRFMLEAEHDMTLRMETDVIAIENAPNGQLRVTFENGEQAETDVVLFATGRKANTHGLGLENTVVITNPDGSIRVDADFRTAEPSIYAIGDVVGRMALTPVALAEGMLVANHLFGDGKRVLSYDNIPTAIFSHPNLATVGLTEEEARERYTDIAVYESDFRHLRHTLSGNPERTYMKVITDVTTDKVLGMHMMGADAGEIIQGFATAMICGLTKSQLDATIGIHPTAAEEFVTMRSRTR
jgi:glutathione reductase (NADPH)